MSIVNACSASILRRKNRQSCFNTCALFFNPHTPSAQKCQEQCQECTVGEATFPTLPQFYKDCLPFYDTFQGALDCCLRKCKQNGQGWMCQEQCIDSYNALQPVGFVENFTQGKYLPITLFLVILGVLYLMTKM